VKPSHRIVQADALAFLNENPAADGCSIITSLPDVSELAQLGFVGWRGWFIATAGALLRWLPPAGVAIFYQSDIRHEGVWVDKSYLVMRAAEQEGAHLLWHKIVCRRPPGTASLGRASYSHMLCFARDALPAARLPTPDVLADSGAMSWSRAMGSAACELACRYLREQTQTRSVIDPFCGRGSVLAVALAHGFDVIGVDISAKRCRAARSLLANVTQPGDPFERGARMFDQGDYFEAHEAWEERWRISSDESERRFLQGLIQVAAAFHKLYVMSAPDAALRLLAKALSKLNACPERIGDFDVAAFRSAISACAQALSAGQLQRGSIPRVG
jgi:predicted metal-dependent hydrolase